MNTAKSFSSERSSSLSGSVHRARASIVDSTIQVAVMFTDNSQPMILWDFEKFESRLYLMREMFNDYSLDHGNLNRLNALYTNAKDPFWDPPESRLIGTAVLYLDSLSFLLEIEETTPIIDFKGKQVGELTCELIALSVEFEPQKGQPKRESIKLVDNFEEFQLKNFIGGLLCLEMHVVGGRGLPNSLCNDVEARWSFWNHSEMNTKQIKGPTIAPDFNSVEQIQIHIDHDFVHYVQNESLEIEVWGRPSTFVQTKNNKNSPLMPSTVPELQNALKEERAKRKSAEERIAELTSTASGSAKSNRGRSESMEGMRDEIEALKKQLAAAPKSNACRVM
jgi:hypothetical protein|tara:strand:+ start:118 stop:1125 length:1008 start_codon:yes stop_codon:yes gene_type:complete